MLLGKGSVMLALTATVISLIVLLHVIPQQSEEYTINISGSTSVKPLMDLWATRFMDLHPKYRIDVSGGGSGKGVQQVATGVIDIGMHSRPILPEDPKFKGVTFTAANDGVLVVANKKVPLIGLTREALQAIFSYSSDRLRYPVETYAKVEDEGGTVDVKILIYRRSDGTVLIESDDGEYRLVLQPYVRAESSGTAETFAVFLYGSWEAKWSGPQGKGVPGNQGMVQAIVSDPRGIGYISSAYFDPRKMKALLIVFWDGRELRTWNNYSADVYNRPTPEAIAMGAEGDAVIKPEGNVPGGYPIARKLYISVNLGKYGGKIPHHIVSFLTWCFTRGQKYVDRAGYVPLSREQVNRNMQLLGKYGG
ncbi:MAG: hypothetical protein DRJ59_08365 [Thermoprotei archaeon]|nr:MAG: hypothetical protein DRJ59_08365 [Thermoprotei archaeon]